MLALWGSLAFSTNPNRDRSLPATARWRMKKFILDFLLRIQPSDKITITFPRIITKRRTYRNISCSVLKSKYQFSHLNKLTLDNKTRALFAFYFIWCRDAHSLTINYHSSDHLIRISVNAWFLRRRWFSRTNQPWVKWCLSYSCTEKETSSYKLTYL